MTKQVFFVGPGEVMPIWYCPHQNSAHYFCTECSRLLITSFTDREWNPGSNKVSGILPHSFQWSQDVLQICELEQQPLGKARVMVCLMHLHVYICSHLSSSAAAAEGQTPSALSALMSASRYRRRHRIFHS